MYPWDDFQDWECIVKARISSFTSSRSFKGSRKRNICFVFSQGCSAYKYFASRRSSVKYTPNRGLLFSVSLVKWVEPVTDRSCPEVESDTPPDEPSFGYVNTALYEYSCAYVDGFSGLVLMPPVEIIRPSILNPLDSRIKSWLYWTNSLYNHPYGHLVQVPTKYRLDIKKTS